MIVSCKPAPVQEIEAVESVDYAAMNLQQTKMNLTDNAQKIALEWTAIQDLFTALENYDHSIAATIKLLDHVDVMLEDTPQAFQGQSIISRIKVLKTRIHIYQSYLGYRIKTNKNLENKYNAIIKALDDLILQMNLKVNEDDGINKKLLEDLKADLDPEVQE
ncbi:MAG: hypothetical protein ABF274_09005 [Nonlabens sp.]|uniref:hypothetical protein n=1 Tax=Nonlabens sp. TaxID=1888209 RepID=UPI00321C1113